MDISQEECLAVMAIISLKIKAAKLRFMLLGLRDTAKQQKTSSDSVLFMGFKK